MIALPWGSSRGIVMKAVLLAGPLLLLCPALSHAQNGLVPPQIVRLESMQQDSEMRIITVGNAQKHYTLYCNVKAEGCITPERGQTYLLFDMSTRWKMPGAKDYLTLAGIQDWTVKYNNSENIGLVPEGNGGPGLGMFILDGIEQDTIFSDGPIIYGAGMSDQDRQRAWKAFFMKMIEAVARQQGKDALGVKLARRCMPGQDFCTTALDASFVGIRGMTEPSKVVLIVSTNVRDSNQQLSRMVCTWPKGKQVCREWDTGKLVVEGDEAQ
jgi:hypothetical protein